MGRLKDILGMSKHAADSDELRAAVRDRAADALRPGHVWVAGIRLPAPSASSLMALCIFGSPFVSSKGVELLETEMHRHVAVAAYCLAMRSEAIPAAHARDESEVARWAETELAGIDWMQAAQDLMLCISATSRGFELFSDDTQKKTAARPRSPNGARSSSWLARLLGQRSA